MTTVEIRNGTGVAPEFSSAAIPSSENGILGSHKNFFKMFLMIVENRRILSPKHLKVIMKCLKERISIRTSNPKWS